MPLGEPEGQLCYLLLALVVEAVAVDFTALVAQRPDRAAAVVVGSTATAAAQSTESGLVEPGAAG